MHWKWFFKTCILPANLPWGRAWQPTPVFLPGEPTWTGEPGGPQSKGSQRVWHKWSDLACSHITNANGSIIYQGAPPTAQLVKNMPAGQETQVTWVQFLGWEDPLEEEMAIHCSILAWKIPWTGELLAGSSLRGHIESDMTKHMAFIPMIAILS